MGEPVGESVGESVSRSTKGGRWMGRSTGGGLARARDGPTGRGAPEQRPAQLPLAARFTAGLGGGVCGLRLGPAAYQGPALRSGGQRRVETGRRAPDAGAARLGI